MNRLAKFSLSSPKHLLAKNIRNEPRLAPLIRTNALHYHLLGPIGYEPNYAYPLVIWLHGAGDDERQLLNIMPHVSMRNYVSIGLRGDEPQMKGLGYSWSLSGSCIDHARSQVHQAIEIACARYHVRRDRIFIAGLHAGGTLALRLALSEPELFGGAISVGGRFPTGSAALWRYHSAQDLPILMMRGLESVDYSDSVFCDEIKLFHAARLRVHARQYLCGDEVDALMLRDMNAWIMERVTGQAILEQQDSANSF